jgi:FHS family glucose/mannose:H+ symporter-like MFS transporter
MLTSDAISTQVSFSPFAFASTTTVFLLIGATSSLYGPLLISFSHRFHVSLPEAGIVLSMHFVGALFGVPLGWFTSKRLSGRAALSVALFLMAAGACGVAFLHSWFPFLACVFVIGVGFGDLDFLLNTLMARTAFKGRAHRMSVGNAGYGVGAVVGPLLIILLAPKNFPLLFGGIAVTAVLLSSANRGVHAPPLRAEANQRELTMMKAQRRPILITFIVAFIFYVAAETSTSGWLASQLHRVGYSSSLGSFITAAFWSTLALGRVFGGPLHKKFGDHLLVIVGLTLTIALCLGAYFNVLAPYAYPLMGLTIASVYPMGLIWYTVLCPHDSDGLALMILFMMIGGIIGPGSESLLVSLVGIHVVPAVIASYAILALGVFVSALRFHPIATRTVS